MQQAFTQTKETEEDILNMEFGHGAPDLIPQGIYEAKVIRLEKSPYMGTDKLYIHMVITSVNYSGVELYMPINLPSGKRFGVSSKFYKSWMVANNDSKPARADKMSPRIFKDTCFEVNVRNDANDEYSVIDSLRSRLG